MVKRGDFNFKCARLFNIDLNEIEVKENLILTRSKVKNDVKFNNAKIYGDMLFDGAHISGNAFFEFAKIYGNISFYLPKVLATSFNFSFILIICGHIISHSPHSSQDEAFSSSFKSVM